MTCFCGADTDDGEDYCDSHFPDIQTHITVSPAANAPEPTKSLREERVDNPETLPPSSATRPE